MMKVLCVVMIVMTCVISVQAKLPKVSQPVPVVACPTADLFENPIQPTGADPWVIKHNGKYYLSESNGGQQLFIKESKTITGIGDAVAQKVFDFSTQPQKQFTAWAPHLDYIRGEWYLYYCAQLINDPSFKHQRMLVLKSLTDSPFGPYENMGEVLDSGDKEWAIDGSILERKNGDLYFIWSGTVDFVTLHQSTYIAKMLSPTRIDRNTITLISEASLPWETSVRPIQEGQRPLFIDKEGKTIIMYSANASWTDEYCLGSLTNSDGDFLNPKSWKKSPKPLFEKTKTIFGPGGASYVKSPDGSEDWIIYHSAKKSKSGWDRQINAQPFSWSKSGDPIFGEPIAKGVKIKKPSGE